MAPSSIASTLGFLLVACAGNIATTITDADKDGYSTAEDCDDSDGTIHPGAREYCNGIDEDCDGQVDEGVKGSFYLDNDSDGFGDPDQLLESCQQPDYYVEDDSDCDDANADRHPGAEEYCNGADDDCDGQVDEDDAVDSRTWYRDADSDGYGDASATATACQRPSGYVEDDTDCNDGSDGVYPGADEHCDGVDEDCDGDVDEDAVDMVTWYRDADLDGYGDASVSTTACEAPLYFVNDDTDCDDTEDDANPGADEVCDGIDNDCDGDIDPCCVGSAEVIQLMGEEPSSYAGYALSGAGDVDGDGFDDLLVGAYAYDDEDEMVGAAYLLYGPVTEDRNLSLADVKLVGEKTYDYAGRSLSSAGDVNGDDFDDLLIGANGNDEGGSNAGAAYLLFGPITSDNDLSSADAKFIGEDSSDWAGGAVSGAGDVDGDGFDDMLIGAEGDDNEGASEGALYLLNGPITEDRSLSLADAKLGGESSYDYAGYAVSGAGDVNGDGFDDMLVGAYGNDEGGEDAGAAYLIYGPVTAHRDLSLADAKLIGEEERDYAGRAVSGPGDVNGDGFADLLLGAYGNDEGGLDAGAAYLLYGPVTANRDLSMADAKFQGDATNAQAGAAVSGAGDLDGDGFADLLVGTPYRTYMFDHSSGAVYVVYGPVTADRDLSLADAKLIGEDEHNLLGSAVAGTGDVDGDGLDDFMIGAYGNDDGGSLAGTAYLVLCRPGL